MELPEKLDDLGERFQRDLKFLGVSIAVLLVAVAGHNLVTPDEPVRVGFVEVETRCAGIDAGACIGVQRRTHTTYNYDDYSKVQRGTENFYRRVEAELMAQAYNICTADMKGMEWTSRASYLNKTGDEWRQMEQVELLGCEQTTFRNMTEG
ncbi:MAG: hypothetical protein ABEJ64_03330 [Candidatus Nanohaloarchaea archaeon]